MENYLEDFDVYISELVIEEASSGDPVAAKERLEVLYGIEQLKIADEVEKIASEYIKLNLLDEKSIRDAFHIAIATYHAMDLLVTWNFKHIANITIIRQLAAINEMMGYQSPILCSPAEAMEL